jgi:NCS1 family nucleobase:cation symporter-1
MLAAHGSESFTDRRLRGAADNVSRIYAFAWLYGFFTTSAAYYVICTYISPQTVSLVDEAVYPPGKDVAISPIEGSALGEDMKETAVTEKETSPV